MAGCTDGARCRRGCRLRDLASDALLLCDASRNRFPGQGAAGASPLRSVLAPSASYGFCAPITQRSAEAEGDGEDGILARREYGSCEVVPGKVCRSWLLRTA
jgi:hypothetical protein